MCMCNACACMCNACACMCAWSYNVELCLSVGFKMRVHVRMCACECVHVDRKRDLSR